MTNNPNNAPAGAPTPERLKQRASRRLLAALLLIAVAIGGLALTERWRQPPAITPPPHEPSQALQQQLVKAGIPAHTETRVQLGPFQDRREAETALAKVKKLGVDAVLVAPH